MENERQHFEKVRYHDLYPGIDLVYYGHERQLEYDFVVAPGADANRILLSFRADGLSSTATEISC